MLLNSNLKFYIKSGTYQSEYFLTELGLPQGCCCSPLLYLLFASDMGKCFTHKGVSIGETNVPYLQFADDLVIICESAAELQTQIDNFIRYCEENFLKINTLPAYFCFFTA